MEPQSQWPGAFGIFKPSMRTVGFNLGTYIGLFMTTIAASIAIAVIASVTHSKAISDVGNLVVELVGLLFSGATTVVLLNASKSEKTSYSDALKQSASRYPQFLGLSIMIGLIAIVSFILLIVPFFIVVPRLVLARYFMFDQNMGVMDSLRASWNQTSGHVGKVWGIIGATILMVLTGILIITIPLTIFLVVAYSAANILLYRHVIANQTAPAAPVTPAV